MCLHAIDRREGAAVIIRELGIVVSSRCYGDILNLRIAALGCGDALHGAVAATVCAPIHLNAVRAAVGVTDQYAVESLAL